MSQTADTWRQVLMDMTITINGVALQPDQTLAAEALASAGLSRLSLLRARLRRLPGGFQYWEAANPRVSCFDGQVDIYACRDGYLDPDRRWKTSLLLCERQERLQWLELRVLEGVYAAGNYYDRFQETAGSKLGPPDRTQGRQVLWRSPPVEVSASLSTDAETAIFRLVWQSGSDQAAGGGR
jgi:hypothetical protein